MASTSTMLSESALGQELEKLTAILALARDKSSHTTAITAAASATEASHDSEQWKGRLAALQRLQTLAEEDVSARRIFVEQYLAPVRVALVEHLTDARTAIVRTACAAIAAFAAHSTNHSVWLSLCLSCVPPLLSQTASTTKLVAQAANDTLVAVAHTGGFSAEALGELLKGFNARHPTVRAHAATTLLSYMQRVKGTPKQVSMSRFTVPMSKVIAAGVHDADERVRKAARQCFWGFQAMEPEAAARLRDSLDVATRALLDRDRANALRLVGFFSGGHSGSQWAPSSAVVSPPASSRPTSTDVGPRRRQDRLREVVATQARRSGSVRSHGARTEDRTRSSSSSAARVGVSTATAVDVVAVLEAPVKENAEKEWGVILEGLGSTDWQLRLDAVSALRVALPAAMEAETDTPTMADATEALLAEPSPVAAAVAELTRRVSDPHFRVCLAALDCLSDLLAQQQQQKGHPWHPPMHASFRTHTPELVLGLLVDTCSRKAAVAQRAHTVLGELLAQLPANLAVTTLFQCLDDVSTAAVRCRIVEVLQRLVEERSQDFEGAAPSAPHRLTGTVLRGLTRFLHRVEGYRTAKGSPEGPAAAAALRSLLEHAPKGFAAATVTLSSDEQDLVRRVLASHVRPPAGVASPLLVEAPVGGELPRRALPPSSTHLTKGGVAAPTAPRSPPRREAENPELARPATPADKKLQGYTISRSSLARRPLRTPRANTALSIAATSKNQQPPQREAFYGVDLFSTAFSPRQFANPNEPLSAPFPVDGEACRNKSPSRSRQVAIPSLKNGRRATGDDNSASTSGTSLYTADAHKPALPIAEMMAFLTSVDSTTDELCSALDAASESLGRHRERWPAGTAAQLLTILVDRLCTEAVQPQHAVRRRAFETLRVLLLEPSMRPTLAHDLSRVLRATRAGLDDAFYEVQQAAAIAAQTAWYRCALPVDLVLNSLACVLEAWQRGPQRDSGTRGWLELLSEVGRTLERVDGAVLVVSEVVTTRVVRIVVWLLSHCTAAVRRTSVLVLVALWRSLGSGAYSFLALLNAAQRKLISIYYNKALLEAAGAPRDSVEAMMQELLVAKAARRGVRTKHFRDLNEELVAAGFRPAFFEE